MSNTYLNPCALFPSQQYGFSQGVAAAGKTTVYVSGQVGWNAAQQITDPTDLGAQTRQALENLEIAVRAGGGTRTDIVSLRLAFSVSRPGSPAMAEPSFPREVEKILIATHGQPNHL